MLTGAGPQFPGFAQVPCAAYKLWLGGDENNYTARCLMGTPLAHLSCSARVAVDGEVILARPPYMYISRYLFSIQNNCAGREA
jgi:hypothetical protein